MTTTLLIALAALAPAQRPNPHAEIEQKLIGQTVTTLAPAATDRSMPTVLVYWKNPCPHNPAAAKLFNGVAEAYAGKVKMHGIVNADEAGAVKFKEQFTKPYSVLADADKALIKKSGFTRSIVTVVANKEGKVTHVFGGYGAEALNGLNAALATTLGMQAPTIEALAAAPQRMTYG